MTKARLEALFAQLRSDHADLWRTLSLSDEWRRLQALEAKLDLLATLIKEYADDDADDPR